MFYHCTTTKSRSGQGQHARVLYSSFTGCLTWFIHECMLWNWPLSLSFIEEIPTLEGVSVAENGNVQGLPSRQHAPVSQGWVCIHSCLSCHAEIKLQIKLSIPPCHSILTPGQPVPALSLWRQAPGTVATGVPIFKSLVWLCLKKSWHNRESKPGSAARQADTLTTGPTRRTSTGPAGNDPQTAAPEAHTPDHQVIKASATWADVDTSW